MHPIDPFFAPRSALRLLVLPAALLALAGCDQVAARLGLNEAQLMDTEAKAIGGACRHALRGVEDCYTLNPKAPKAAVFDGWKEMDQYMRDNKIEGTPAVVARPAEPPPKRAAARASAPAEH